MIVVRPAILIDAVQPGCRLCGKAVGEGDVCRRVRLRGGFGRVDPISTLMSEPQQPTDGGCRSRSRKTVRCASPKRPEKAVYTSYTPERHHRLARREQPIFIDRADG